MEIYTYPRHIFNKYIFQIYQNISSKKIIYNIKNDTTIGVYLLSVLCYNLMTYNHPYSSYLTIFKALPISLLILTIIYKHKVLVDKTITVLFLYLIGDILLSFEDPLYFYIGGTSFGIGRVVMLYRNSMLKNSLDINIPILNYPFSTFYFGFSLYLFYILFNSPLQFSLILIYTSIMYLNLVYTLTLYKNIKESQRNKQLNINGRSNRSIYKYIMNLFRYDLLFYIADTIIFIDMFFLKLPFEDIWNVDIYWLSILFLYKSVDI